ncbi:MAG: alpha/beta fold hydrolase [Pseudomonadota bacterium]
MTQDEPLPELAATAARITTPCGGDPHGLSWYRWDGGPGLPVVLFHGGSGSWRHWARNIAALSKHRPVFAPDLPGLGTSTMPEDPAGPEEAAAALLAGLPMVIPGAFHLVGFSFGAMVSGLVAAQAENLASLSLIGPAALGTPRQPVPLEKLRDKAGTDRREAHRANLNALMLHNPDAVDDTAIAIQEWNTVHARLRSRGFATSTRLRVALPRVAAPVQAIWGARDQVAYPALHERVDVLRATRPDAIVTTLPETGHWAAYEAPEAVNTLLSDFHARHDR